MLVYKEYFSTLTSLSLKHEYYESLYDDGLQIVKEILATVDPMKFTKFETILMRSGRKIVESLL